jgi:hypothetical protein
MPALFTVLVGDDPERLLAVHETDGDWMLWQHPGVFVRAQHWQTVHDVQPFIPEGTPVGRIVVLPEPQPVKVDEVGNRACGDGRAVRTATTSGCQVKIMALLHEVSDYRAIQASIAAARAAEPKCRKMHGRWSCCRDASHCGAHDTGETEHGRVVWSTPDHDPLAQARERLYRSVNWDHSGATVEVSKSDLAAVVHPPLAATEGGAS